MKGQTTAILSSRGVSCTSISEELATTRHIKFFFGFLWIVGHAVTVHSCTPGKIDGVAEEIRPVKSTLAHTGNKEVIWFRAVSLTRAD